MNATAVAGLCGAVPARRAAGLAAFDLSGTLSGVLLSASVWARPAA